MVNLPFWGGLRGTAHRRLLLLRCRLDRPRRDRARASFRLATNGFTVRGNVLAAPIATEYHDVNDVEKTAVRVSAVFKPIDGLTITPSYFYQKLRSGGLPYIDSDPGTDAHYQPFDIAESYRDEFQLEALSVKYRTDDFEISSATRLLVAARAAHSGHLGVVDDRPRACRIGITGYGPGQRRHRCGLRG